MKKNISKFNLVLNTWCGIECTFHKTIYAQMKFKYKICSYKRFEWYLCDVDRNRATFVALALKKSLYTCLGKRECTLHHWEQWTQHEWDLLFFPLSFSLSFYCIIIRMCEAQRMCFEFLPRSLRCVTINNGASIEST